MQDLTITKKNTLKKNAGLLSLGILVFLSPLLYYHRVLIPDSTFSLAINNDFIPVYYNYKVHLLDLLASGHFPLWSPAEASGYPFYSSPFTQAFYPLNIPLAIFYKIAGGYSIFDHQIFTVLGVSIYALGLFLWLSLLISNIRAVFFTAILISLSFKLGEILRSPNAVHTAAWIPWILYGITLAPVKGKYLWSSITIFLSSIMLLTGGYPYYAYYCLFLIPPYVFFFLFSGSRAAIITKTPLSPLLTGRFLWTLTLSFSAAFAVCAPYLVKMCQLMAQTVNRTGLDYKYATFFDFDVADTLGSLIFPPAAQAEGWYYFSMLGVFLLVLFAAGFFVVPHPRRNDGLFLFFLVTWFALISSITYGKDSYLFSLLWQHMPGFSSLRVWGRLNIILLPILAMLLIRAYQFFESLLSGYGLGGPLQRRTLILLIIVLTGIALTVIATQVWLYQQRKFDNYWLLFFKPVNGTEWIFIFYSALSIVLMTSVLIFTFKRPVASSRSLPLFLILFLLVAVTDLYPVGSSQWMQKAPPNYGAERKTLEFRKIIEKSLTTPRARLYYTITFPRFNVGWVHSWYFDRYRAFEQKVFSENKDMIGPGGKLQYGTPMRLKNVKDPGGPRSYAELMGLIKGKRIFVSQKIDHVSIKDFLSDAVITEAKLVPELALKYYDGDNLEFFVQSLEPVYVSFIDNWDPDWKAVVNGEPKSIEKLFGTFKSIRIGPGKNIVKFSYRPFF
jgi:hypothetical protein